MTQYLNVFSGRQFIDANGNPYSGAKLFTYSAGSSTKVTTTKDQAGTSNHANPIVLNTKGEPADAGGASMLIWQAGAQTIKLVLAPANDTDPPVSPISTWDNLSGINDASVSIDQWISGPAPTFVNTTQFTLVGDQTSTFHVGRRVKLTDSGGTDYGVITVSAYTTLTTVTVAVDGGGVLDSGLSAVNYGLLSASNPSIPGVRISGLDWTHAGKLTVEGKLTIVEAPALQGRLAALKLSNGSDATNDIDIAVGGAMSSDSLYWMTLASALTKQLDAVWAVGTNAGMRASGAAITDTTYHLFLIARPDTGVVDIAADTSATGANIEANTNAAYTKRRRIGSILRESGAIVGFDQNGNEFRRNAGVLDSTQTNPGTSAVSLTLSVPTGIVVEALLAAAIDPGTSGSAAWLLSPLDADDQTPALTASMALTVGSAGGTGDHVAAQARVKTNTSRQIRSRVSASGASDIFRLTVFGWIDTRGRED